MARNSEEMKKEVVDQLYWDVRLDASDIEVTVDNNRVTLTGTVPSFQARNAAVEDAYAIPGVFAVDDNISVRYVEPLPPDEEIETRIRSSLEWNADVKSDRIEVQVDDGVVTLRGKANTLWEKLEAENVTSSIKGATYVVNNIAVVPTGDVVDEQIAARVTEALERGFLVDADKIDVTVQDGVVILEGKVPSWNSRNLVLNIVRSTPGVVDIDNRLLLGI